MTESFQQLFEQSLASQQIRPGQILTGTVVDVNADVVIVSVGLKSEAVIPIDQFRNDNGEIEVTVGQEVEVALDAVEDGSGETRLSREKAKRARTWTRLEEAFTKGEIVKGVINGRVKGGFTVELDNVRAFLPGSLVDVRPVRDPSYLEGKELEFKVIKLDQRRNNVVVSRRAVVEQEYSAERSQLLDNLKEGDVVKGVVKNLTDYGAFVDLGGIDIGDSNALIMDASAELRASLGRVAPLVQFGGGAIRREVSVAGISADGTDFHVSAGIGVDIPIASNVGLRLMAKDHYGKADFGGVGEFRARTRDIHALAITGGLQITF
jgi:transcriptional accessory protein Tex/SPT6